MAEDITPRAEHTDKNNGPVLVLTTFLKIYASFGDKGSLTRNGYAAGKLH